MTKVDNIYAPLESIDTGNIKNCDVFGITIHNSLVRDQITFGFRTKFALCVFVIEATVPCDGPSRRVSLRSQCQHRLPSCYLTRRQYRFVCTTRYRLWFARYLCVTISVNAFICNLVTLRAFV